METILYFAKAEKMHQDLDMGPLFVGFLIFFAFMFWALFKAIKQKKENPEEYAYKAKKAGIELRGNAIGGLISFVICVIIGLVFGIIPGAILFGLIYATGRLFARNYIKTKGYQLEKPVAKSTTQSVNKSTHKEPTGKGKGKDENEEDDDF